MDTTRSDLARITLSVLFIGGLIVGALWILRPFLASLIWAVMIVVATWPLMRRLETTFGGRRGPAVVVMTLGLLAILIVPLGVALQAIFANSGDIAAIVTRLPEATLPAAPDWLGRMPLVGTRLTTAWNEVASAGVAGLLALAEPYLRIVATWLTQHAGGFALVVVQFVLIVILSAILYAGGESWAAWVRRFGERLADTQGGRMVILAGQAIRGVALGVVVTALIQSVVGGIGLAIAGIPFVGVLTAVMFALCIAQLGPLLVLLGATAWAFYALGTGWGVFLLVWSAVVGLMDNVIRPVLIRRGADLPLLLIFAGVIGGMIAFGIVGIFIGPVILAVAYTLLDDWVSASPARPEPLPAPAGEADQ
jgi:predicted PurR-regulated permease PerM